jgi:hypothetical protein
LSCFHFNSTNTCPRSASHLFTMTLQVILPVSSSFRDSVISPRRPCPLSTSFQGSCPSRNARHICGRRASLEKINQNVIRVIVRGLVDGQIQRGFTTIVGDVQRLGKGSDKHLGFLYSNMPTATNVQRKTTILVPHKARLGTLCNHLSNNVRRYIVCNVRKKDNVSNISAYISIN